MARRIWSADSTAGGLTTSGSADSRRSRRCPRRLAGLAEQAAAQMWPANCSLRALPKDDQRYQFVLSNVALVMKGILFRLSRHICNSIFNGLTLRHILWCVSVLCSFCDLLSLKDDLSMKLAQVSLVLEQVWRIEQEERFAGTWI